MPNENNIGRRPSPPPLPATNEEWNNLRHIKHERTLNDMTEDVHRALMNENHADYKKYMYAVWDEQAEEGSLAADNLEAAAIIRVKAERMGFAELARQKKTVIVKSLNVVLRRYHQTRKERRQMVAGEVVPTDD